MSTKQWFIAYFAVYLVLGVGILALFGPRDFTAEYLAQYEADHERYLTTTKRPEYQILQERPHLHPPPPALAADFAFAVEYENREAYQQERTRRSRFDNSFALLNFLMVAYLVYHFGKRPLLRFLDERIEDTRERVKQAEHEREQAVQAKADAEARLASLQIERDRLAEKNAALIAEEKRRLQEFAQIGLNEIDQETEQRRKAELLDAKRRVRAELLDRAVNQLLERYQAEASPERLSRLTAEFTRELEMRA